MCNTQRTLEWWVARIGKATASKSSVLKTNGKKTILGAGAYTYMNHVIGERLSGLPKLIRKTKEIIHGEIYEKYAVKEYEKVTGLKVDLCGFIQSDKFNCCGGSPDGLIGNDGCIEIKCKNTENHVDYLLKGFDALGSDHEYQIQFNIWNTKRNWCDFISFDPSIDSDLKIKIIRVERDETVIKNIEEKMQVFSEILSENMIKLTGTTEYKIDEDKLLNFLIENNEINIDIEM